MLIVSNIKLDIDSPVETALEKAKKLLGVQADEIKDISIHKISTDARKGDVKFVCSVCVRLENAKKEQLLAEKTKAAAYKQETDLEFFTGERPMSLSPVICGFGPAGLMCALVLSRMGFKPVVLEQGSEIDKRTAAVKNFENGGNLDLKSNIQFGEGGAGTFSDGKLTTRIGDERCGFVTKTFIAHGAPKDISQKAKPHIGTDLLVDIIKSIRNEIISLGGTVLFDTALTNLKIKNGSICGVITTKGEIPTENLIMATGHSARDVFFMLKSNGVNIEAKPFSVGVRIEHLQSEIDKALYHSLAGHSALSQGEYQLSCDGAGRGVYTFCMCPGGKVVAAASEENTVVVNGMSYHARDGKNANSALVVSVTPDDFDGDFTKAIAFQRRLEQTAFVLGGENYKAPCQTVDNFLKGKKGANLKRVMPSYPIGTAESDFSLLFPENINQSLRQALPIMGRRLSGFDAPDSVLTGVETRTSSPARILRAEDFQNNIKGLYPCGEGAGYAGGIMSAAVDGVRIAQYISAKYKPNF